MEATQEKAQPQKAGGEVRIKVTSSQFRQNQKKLFDVVRAGGSVCITQGGNTFRLVQDDVECVVATPEFLEKLAKAKEELATGRCLRFRTDEELQAYLDSRKAKNRHV